MEQNVPVLLDLMRVGPESAALPAPLVARMLPTQFVIVTLSESRTSTIAGVVQLDPLAKPAGCCTITSAVGVPKTLNWLDVALCNVPSLAVSMYVPEAVIR